MNAFCLRSAFLMTVALHFLTHSVAQAADVTLTIPGASPAEMRPIAAALNGAAPPKAFDDILNRTPDNRPALLLRAQYRMGEGDTLAAAIDLERLAAISPDFPQLRSTLAELYRVKGDTKAEIAAIESLIQKPVDAADDRLTKMRRARVAELNGDLESASIEWQKAIDAAPTFLDGFFRIRFSQFQLRHGMHKEAIDELKKLSRSIDPATKAAAQFYLNFGLWIIGESREAAEQFQAANARFEALPSSDPQIQVLSSLGAYFLTPEGGREREMAGIALRAASDKLNGFPGSLKSISQSIAAKKPSGQIEHLKTVLKAAPGLEWAQWSAAFLIMNKEDGAKSLIPLLPIDSLPGKLVDNSLKSTTTRQEE